MSRRILMGTNRAAAFVSFALLLALVSWAAWPDPIGSRAMVVSVSSDGTHAVSSHRGNELVLWNLEERTYRLISEQANIYSGYFVEGRNLFLWQDLDGMVHVDDLKGNTRRTFEHFPVYGHVMSPDLQHYFASNEDWEIYKGYGNNQESVKRDGDSPSFPGIGKLLNLDLHARQGYLLSAGSALSGDDEVPIEESAPIAEDQTYSRYAGVVLWDAETGRPLHKLPGNAAKTHATLSPDGRNAVSVDENGIAYLWNTERGGRNQVSRIGSGVYEKSDNERLGTFTTQGMHLDPEKFPADFDGGPQISVQFVGPERFMIFFTDQPYAALYKRGDPFARAILELGTDPAPSVYRYDRNAAIDSAPRAGVLVTGQRDGGGINVYDFDVDSRSLERVWAPTP